MDVVAYFNKFFSHHLLHIPSFMYWRSQPRCTPMRKLQIPLEKRERECEREGGREKEPCNTWFVFFAHMCSQSCVLCSLLSSSSLSTYNSFYIFFIVVLENSSICKHLVMIIIHDMVNGLMFFWTNASCFFFLRIKLHGWKLCIWHHLSVFIAMHHIQSTYNCSCAYSKVN